MSPPAPTQDEMLLHMLEEMRSIMSDISTQTRNISLATGHLKLVFDTLIARMHHNEEASP